MMRTVAAVVVLSALPVTLAHADADPKHAVNPKVVHTMPFGIELVAADPGFSANWTSPPAAPAAAPTENDDGSHIKLSWQKSPSALATGYVVYRHPGDAKAPPELTYSYFRVRGKATAPKLMAKGDWSFAGKVGADAQSYRDTVGPRAAHSYAIFTYREGEGPGEFNTLSAPLILAKATTPEASWFNTKRWFFLLVIVAMALALYAYIAIVRKDPASVFIRRIAGVDAIEEAVGRSTEMGRPVLYVTGVEEIQNIQTIASLLVLGRVAEMTAEYDTEMKVANFFPLTMVVAEEIVKQGYANAGRIDAHKPENVMFISAEQFAFAAGVNGLILRDKPACNIYLGRFFAESLILAETGYVTKAIQIAGTAEITQLPFFIAACDYTIIGEELYAVSAYLSREPNLLAQLKASDLLKVGILGIVIIGAALSFFDVYNVGAFLLP